MRKLRLIGRCRPCKKSWGVEVPYVVETVQLAMISGATRYFVDSRVRFYGEGRWRDWYRATPPRAGYCPECKEPRGVVPIRGRYSDKKQCGARCMAAVGPSCECSCAGENHGSNHF